MKFLKQATYILRFDWFSTEKFEFKNPPIMEDKQCKQK